MHLPLGPGLKSLMSLSQQCIAQEHWEAQESGEAKAAASFRPHLSALLLAQVWDDEDLMRLAATLSSIRQQWRAPPDCTAISIFVASEDLREQTNKLLSDFKEAIEAPGPRLAFSEGLAKAVLCQVFVVELDCPACEGEQLRHLLQVVPEGDNSWILFSSPGGIWHPGRSGFFRNFTRQVPGKRKCTSTVAPLIVRPVQAVPLLRSAVEVNRRLQLPDGDVEVMEEARHAVQYCVRRTLLSQFLDTWTHVQFTNEQCFDQLWAFIVEENAEKCFQVATTQLYEGALQGATPLWMYYAPWQRERAG